MFFLFIVNIILYCKFYIKDPPLDVSLWGVYAMFSKWYIKNPLLMFILLFIGYLYNIILLDAIYM